MRELSNAEVNLVSGGVAIVRVPTPYGGTLLFGPCTFQKILDRMGNMKTSGESSR